MIMNSSEFCIKQYTETYKSVFSHVAESSRKASKRDILEREAQKEAMKITIISAMEKYPDEEPAELWKAVQAAHIDRKSGIADLNVITSVISAEQSWKKSSGHAFEEMVVVLGNRALEEHGISICLQKKLNSMISNNEISNQVQDIKWLKKNIQDSTFDIYAFIENSGQKFVFGCIQSKTSIRDRVTRDREPSTHAMENFFWSVAICLDGEFLKLPKFKSMVNGGTANYPSNGWHGMYVFSKLYKGDRIYPLTKELEPLKEHAKQAANQWLKQRQWLNSKWRPPVS